jgi:hypothetical protein
MERFKLAVICKYHKDFMWYIKYHRKDPKECVWVHDHKSALGRYYRGYTLVGSREHEVEDLEFIIDYIEMSTRKNIQDCLDTLDEKRKVLNWLIDGYGKTGLPFSAVKYLTIDRICEVYHTEPEYFENC